MQPRYAIVISTADRSPHQNYLIDTLNNLHQGGVFTSRISHEVVLVDTGKGNVHRTRAMVWFATHGIQPFITTPSRKGSSPDNAALGLMTAVMLEPEWIIFLEDDIEVCGSFLESVDAWLSENAVPEVPVYPLCAAYGKNAGRNREDKSWRYGLGGFYGTQAYAIRTKYAGELAHFLEVEAEKRNQVNGHDLLLKEWVLSRFPDCTHLLVPGMDFIQHIGKESSIHFGRFHLYPHFGGREWTYRNPETTFYSPDELRRSKFSPNLANLLSKTLDKGKPVYDMGCGIGNYVSNLEKNDFVAVGIEGHPQARTVTVTPSVLSWDLSERLPGFITAMQLGSVISIEVGEHIPKDKEDNFFRNLNDMCSKTLILTWAVKGQGGHRHVNEKDADELIPRVEAMGFKLDVGKTHEWRDLAGMDLHWFKRSIYCFDRE